MKILFLTARFPFPPDRGDRRRANNMIKQLSHHHSIHLLSFIENKNELYYIEEAKQFCENVEIIHLSSLRSKINCGLNFFSKKPLQVSYYTNKRMSNRIKEYINIYNIDIVHTHLLRMAEYVYKLNEITKVLDLTDAISLYLKRFLNKEKNIIKKSLIYLERGRIKEYEKIVKYFDCNLVCTSIDRDEILSYIPEAKIDIISNGVDTEFFNNENAELYEPNTLVFNAAMSYPPNRDAIIFFVENIFDYIKKEIPHIKLIIVGGKPGTKIESFHDNKNIFVTGWVEDVREYYKKAAGSVCPVRFGTGSLNKILEPMALGVPIISTYIGAKSIIGLKNGENILIADEPKEFAAKVLLILKDKNLRTSLSKKGRELVLKNYNLKHITENLENIYKKVLN